ncbi:hypothetical protein [Clostridium tagluense]|uniref:Uncharacterized protein n=1 Tax=Clostridium tagluense TaxID=360422 RepID=A0A401USU5_9CLOT|nr:hypothetical protein [Clostridium tagluense]GCD12625.1 hypothetical protein Ctaglu_42480 [Clostridium tagluense]
MFKKYRQVYVIKEVHENKFQLCKVLNEYETDKEVTDDLKRLLADEITEKDLLKDFATK